MDFTKTITIRIEKSVADKLKDLGKGSYNGAIRSILNQEKREDDIMPTLLRYINHITEQLKIVDKFLEENSNNTFVGLTLLNPIAYGEIGESSHNPLSNRKV